eukprot:scaffold8794_cov207-Skeletonema_menzelii.AAC.1
MTSLSSVKWLPISRDIQQRQFAVKARKGHNSCCSMARMGSRVLLSRVRVESHISHWGLTRLTPRYSDEPIFVYGASLTPLVSPTLSKEVEKDRFMRLRPGIKRRTLQKQWLLGLIFCVGEDGNTGLNSEGTRLSFSYLDT